VGILTNRKLRRAAVAGLVMATSAALAQTAVLKPVANQAAFDRLEQTPAVSGGAIAGVMLIGKPGDKRNFLWLRCFGACAGRFQVQAKSADTRWQGMGTVDSGGVPLKPGMWVRVPLPMSADPAVTQIRNGLKDELIAVLARPVAANNTGIGQSRLLVGWSDRADVPPSGDTVQVSVAAGQMSVSAKLGKAPQLTCQHVSDPEPRGFTHVCRVPLSAIEQLKPPRILIEKNDNGSIQQTGVPLG
jgi:hypothetical protein